MQIPCVYLPGPAPAVTVANNSSHSKSRDSIPLNNLLIQYQLDDRLNTFKTSVAAPGQVWEACCSGRMSTILGSSLLLRHFRPQGTLSYRTRVEKLDLYVLQPALTWCRGRVMKAVCAQLWC